MAIGKDDLSLLKDYILEDRRLPTRIIINILEEKFHLEKVPHVVGKDRKALLSRKSMQLFKNNEFSSYQVQESGKKDKKVRKEDVVLFSSISDFPLIDEVLDILYKEKTPILGIYSSSLLCKKYLKSISDNKVLIISETDNGRFERVAVRQIFLSEGNVKLTRSGTIDVADEASAKEYISKDLESSRNYLIRTQLLNPDEKLPVIFITSTKYLRNLSARDEVIADHFCFRHVEADSLFYALGLQSDNEHIGFEDLLVANAVKASIKSTYSTEKTRYYKKHNDYIRGFKYFSAVAMSVLAGVGMYFMLHSYTFNMSIEANKAAISNLASNIEHIQSQSQSGDSESNQDIFEVRDAVDLINKTKVESVTAETIFSELGRIFSRNQFFLLSNLSWGYKKSDLSSYTITKEQDIDGGMEDDIGLDMSIDDGMEQTAEHLIVSVKGIQVSEGKNYRQLVNEFEILIEDIKSVSEITGFKVKRFPVDISESSQIVGKLTNKTKKADDLLFDIDLILEKSGSEG